MDQSIIIIIIIISSSSITSSNNNTNDTDICMAQNVSQQTKSKAQAVVSWGG